MKTRHPRLSSALLLPFLAACGGSEGGGDWAGTVRDSAGVAIVDNPVDGVWAPDEAWTVEEVFRVGGMDAGTDAEFGSVIGVDVDDQGRVFVADQQGRQIRVFDPEGAFLRTVGAPGEGPGEFGPAVMGVFVSHDTILVPDMGNQRISLFTLEGEPLPTRRLALQHGIPIRWDETSDGDLVAQRRGFDAEGIDALEDGDPIATVPAEGQESRVLATLPKGQSFQISGGAPSFRIFEPEPIWDLAGQDRVAYGMNDVYRIEIREDGSLQRVVTRPVQAVEVTEGEERRIRDMTREMMASTGAPPQAVEQILGQMEFADSYPVFAQVILSEDGTLWVQRIRTSRDVPEGVEWSAQDLGSNEWDVFDPEGRFLGVLEFPLRFQPLRQIDGVMWGLERDDFDVQSVVGYRVVRGV